MTVLSSKSFTEVNSKTRREKGPLVKVQIAPGQFVKMYRADAIAAGHLKPLEKVRPPAENKLRPAVDNKLSDEVASSIRQNVDAPRALTDLTVIPGLGRATARLLASRGITTFEQLRQADISMLGAAARAAIEKWREQEATQ